MNRTLFCLVAAWLVLAPASRAQSTGRVECARNDGYVYLYSSMTTLDVRTTLQCGQQVQITGRYDRFFGVRTAKGEIGYVPLSAVLLFRDADGPPPPQPAAPPSRERVMYDPPAPAPSAAVPRVSSSDLTLRNGTTIHLTLVKQLSSASSKLGDHVDFEAAEDVVVDGLTLVAKGAPAVGTVTEADPKKRLGHGGKLGISLHSVQLTNKQSAPIRGYQETQGASSAAGAVLPLVSGKDVAFLAGTVFTASIDGDVYLKKEAFTAAQTAHN